MSSPVAIMLLIILLLVFVAVVGIFMWSKRHTDDVSFGNWIHENSNKESRNRTKRKFTEDDRQAALFIHELADIMKTVEEKLK